MNPITAILALLGGELAAGGAILESQAKKDEALENAGLAQQAAADALVRGAQEAGRLRIQGSQLGARQKVAYAASGVDPTVGTAAEVQASTRSMVELDAKTAEVNAAREAWGFRRYGTQYTQQAALAQRRGLNEATGAYLTGVGRFAGGY